MRTDPPSIAAACVTALLALGGCGSSNPAERSVARQRIALVAYLRQVEPIRLAVNQLLEGADPILSGYRSGRLSAHRASVQLGALEARFAADAAAVAAIRPRDARLGTLHGAYAHTYVLEDAYLRALARGIATRDFDALPRTEGSQRAAIVRWRVGLEALARRDGLVLPGDLQVAGRGEIAPSPAGS